MADQKITDLTALSSADLNAADLFPVVDASSGTTKSIRKDNLAPELTQVQAENDASGTFGLVSGTRLAQAVAANQADSSFTLLDRQVISNDAVIDFTAFDSSKYDAYEFRLHSIFGEDSGDYIAVRTSSDGGANYDSGTTDYSYTLNSTQDHRSVMLLTDGLSTTQYGINGTVKVFSPQLATRCPIESNIFATGLAYQQIAYEARGIRRSTIAVNAIRFYCTTGTGGTQGGNLVSGVITMHGIRNS